MQIVVWNKWSLLKGDERVINAVKGLLTYQAVDKYGITEDRTLVTKKGAFKTGFLDLVLTKLGEWGVDHTVSDLRVNKFYVDKIVTELPPGALRPNQVAVMKKLFSGDYRGCAELATNFGKNWIIAAITKTVEENSRVVIAVHREELFKQLRDFLGKECGINVSLWGAIGNKAYREIGNVMIINYNSVVGNMDSNLLNHFASVGTLIVDEAHRSQAAQYKKVLETINAYAVFYLSGTLFTGNQLKDLDIIGDSGKLKAKVSNDDLVADGVSQKPIVTIKKLVNTKNLISYGDELAELITSAERLEYIRSVVQNNLGQSVLIAVLSKDHGNNLLLGLADLPTTVEFVHGEDPERADKVESFKVGRTSVLITTEILKEGVNLPLTRHFINAAHGASIVWVLQFAGRLLRHDGKHDNCYLHDFMDFGPNTRAHSNKRLEIYSKEGFEINII
jgi:superfamily II DNA or RNA helicase